MISNNCWLRRKSKKISRREQEENKDWQKNIKNNFEEGKVRSSLTELSVAFRRKWNETLE
jgi:CRISPR/Cas system CSM-associated protein Csm2 small subunit